jgi:hypothetical protein
MILRMRGMGDDDGATSTGPAWVPTYGPDTTKAKAPAPKPAGPSSPMTLIVATALVAAGVVGLATTVNWKRILR